MTISTSVSRHLGIWQEFRFCFFGGRWDTLDTKIPPQWCPGITRGPRRTDTGQHDYERLHTIYYFHPLILLHTFTRPQQQRDPTPTFRAKLPDGAKLRRVAGHTTRAVHLKPTVDILRRRPTTSTTSTRTKSPLHHRHIHKPQHRPWVPIIRWVSPIKSFLLSSVG